MEHFNWKVYIQNYPDLQFMKTQQQAVNHWKRHGKNENRTDKDKIFKDINLEDINFNFIISGEKIQLLCDYFICSIDDINYNPVIKQKIIEQPNKWIDINNFNLIENKINLKIFCYTHILYNQFNELLNLLNLIKFDFDIYFHNSDGNFLKHHYTQLKNIKFIKKIYSQNNTVNEVITLPIGQANTQWVHGNYQVLLNEINLNFSKTNEIFLNFSITTPKRNGLRNILNFIPWVENKKYSDYIHTLSSYKYCICVEGNGLDTHRFWECIYLKVIPICVKNEWTEIVKNIYPMIVI